MRIERVTLSNFRQHESLDVDLGPGLIGVVGPNGSGKSSFVKAILRALTGSTGDPGKNEDDLRDFTDKGFAQVAFKIGNQVGTVKRHLKSAMCHLKFGDLDLRTAGEVNNAIINLMGVSSRVLTDMIFVEQGQLEGILFQAPAERAKAFQVLFGTDDAEAARELIEKELKRNVPDDRSNDIKKIESEIETQIAPALAKASLQLEGIKLLDDATFKACSETLTAFQVQQRAQESMQKAREAFEHTQVQITKGRARLSSLQSTWRQLSSACNDLGPDYQPALNRVQNYGAVCARQSQRNQLLDVIDRCEKVLLNPTPQRTSNPDEVKALQEKLAALRSELDVVQRILQNFSTGVLVCPTCTQSVSPAFIDQSKARYGQLHPQYQQAYGKSAELSQKDIEWNRAYSTWQANQQSSQHHLELARNQLNALPVETPPKTAEFELDKSIVAEYEATQRDCERVSGEVRQIESTLATLEQQLASHSSMLSGSQSAGTSIREADFNQAKAKLEAHANDQRLAANATGQLQALGEQRRQKLETIEKHKAEMANMTSILEWRRILERSRSLLHRDVLPKMVTAAYLEPLNARLGHYLKSFQLPFTAVINSDQSLVCTFTNGVSRSAHRLSGGQKVAMGIAFRFAVYDLFAGNLGFLVLDEPTPFLDKQRRDGVLELLLQIRSYSRSSGLQVIVVTHEESLMGAFDKVIEFKEPRNLTLKPVPAPAAATAKE